MALGSSHWSKYGSECLKCSSTEKLTRHHEYDSKLHRTGRIIVLCKSCHDEFHYIERQMQAERNKIVDKLDEEIEATKNLLREGDPFTITRKDYLDNLMMIRGTFQKTLTQESQS